jgi:hypothetical protein
MKLSSHLSKPSYLLYNIDMQETEFKDLFWNCYLDFQKKTKKSKITAFAIYLSENNRFKTKFSQPLVSGWLNGDFKPSEKYAMALADIMGDEIYNVLQIEKKDIELQRMIALWPSIKEQDRKSIVEQAENFADENDAQRSKVRRPAHKTP